MSIFGFGKRKPVNLPAEDGKNDKPAVGDDGVKYAKLITAQDNAEEAVIESILRSAGIPYVIREASTEGFVRVIMGFNVYGSDFFVPEELLDDAAALLVPEGAEEIGSDPDEVPAESSEEDGDGDRDGDGGESDPE
ncbi:MAG: hypothetical protein ILO42_04605 [Clostridia bacterium]|nr:hypothetical protein [Clostridia bacterium]MBP5270221.1 hypothetical protein [Clostridia bacterium]